ncbi:hypothetical protein E2P73_19575 [Xanthomonas perforans]|nr:hypothetical protein E2P72_15695 [Xanthomonas perforans]TVS61084.1 hypothetical protein E2P73_19575 [Xanthomonas perforans]
MPSKRYTVFEMQRGGKLRKSNVLVMRQHERLHVRPNNRRHDIELRDSVATYPHPNPRSAPRPAPATRALQGTRANGAQAVPWRPDGRGALRCRAIRVA